MRPLKKNQAQILEAKPNEVLWMTPHSFMDD